MTDEQIYEMIRKLAPDYTDSNGDLGIELIEFVQNKLGCSPRKAEQYVTDALGLED